MKHLFTLKSLLLTLVMLCGLNAWGETPVYSLTFTKDTKGSAYADPHETVSGGVAWSVYGNQAQGDFLGVGGKSITNVDRTLTSQSAVSTVAISKITLKHNGISNSGIKINSIKVEGSTVSDFSSDVKTATITSPSFDVSTIGSLDFALESDEWAANSYFRITVNCTNNNTKKNYRFDISSVDFYAASGAVVVSAPTFSAANAADLDPNYSTLGEGTGVITMTSATEGATIYYSTTGEDADDFVKSSTFEGFKASSATDEGVKTIWAYAESASVKSSVASASYTFAQPQVEKPVVNLEGTPGAGSDYLVGQTVKVTATCATDGATLVYSYTNGDDYVALPAEGVTVTSEEETTVNVYVKAVKENYKDSYYVKSSVNFINPPKEVTFTKVTDASQLVVGAKYAIINATTTKIVSGYDGSSFTSTTTSATDGVVNAMDNQVIVFTLGGNGDADNSWTLYDNTKGKYVGGSTSVSFVFGDDASTLKNWTIAFVDTEGSVKIYNGSRGFIFMNSSGAVKNYATSNYGNSSYSYPTLWRLDEPVATKTGLDAVLAGNVGDKYQINCALRVNYKDENYVYASTIGGGSTKTAPTEAQKEEWWSDVEKEFNQNDWVAIQGLEDVQVGAEIEAGSVATLVSNDAFPVVEFVTESHTTGTAIEANTYRVANFVDSDNELVKKLWLVDPQPAEHCFVKGYVASLEDVLVDADAGVGLAEIKSGEKDVVTMYVNYKTTDFSITTPGWYRFEGVVVNGTSSLELNAVKMNEGTATGVEGVETSSVKVYGAEGVINVESEEVAPIAVYSANGAIVSSVEASSASIAVAPGFYIVKAGNSVSKVTVK